MPVPKRRKTASRRKERAQKHKLAPVTVSACASCAASKRPHHACPACGRV